MLAACESALPSDIAVCAAAVSDWRALKQSESKIKKNGSTSTVLELTLNPDILATLAKPSNKRPSLVIGFAAETNDIIAEARDSATKQYDYIVSLANKEIAAETEKARLILLKEISDFAILGSEKILQKEVNKSESEKIVNEMIEKGEY